MQKQVSWSGEWPSERNCTYEKAFHIAVAHALLLLGVGKSDSQKVDPAVHMNKIRIILLESFLKYLETLFVFYYTKAAAL